VEYVVLGLIKAGRADDAEELVAQVPDLRECGPPSTHARGIQISLYVPLTPVMTRVLEGWFCKLLFPVGTGKF